MVHGTHTVHVVFCFPIQHVPVFECRMANIPIHQITSCKNMSPTRALGTMNGGPVDDLYDTGFGNAVFLLESA
jgi:hypothetical protein